MSRLALLVATAALVVAPSAALTACGKAERPPAPRQEDEKRAARTALERLLRRVITDTDYARAGFRADGAATRGFLAAIDRLEAEAGTANAALGADPFLCVQNVPYSIRITGLTIAGSVARARAAFEFDDPAPGQTGPPYRRTLDLHTYGLRREGGTWKLESTECVRPRRPSTQRREAGGSRARDRAVGPCPSHRLRPSPVSGGLVVPNRGAVGVYLGMSLPRLIGCLGSPRFRSDYGVLDYGPADGIFDVGVVGDTVSSLNIAGGRFCLPKRVCLRTEGAIARLRRHYGPKLRLTRDENGLEFLIMESTYRGRPVVTAIYLEGEGAIRQVMISWKHEARPKANPALLRHEGVGPLRLGMTRDAALATGWLTQRGEGCPLGGPPVSVTYRITRPSAPRGIRGVATFVRGRLVQMSFSRGVSTAAGVVVGRSTVAEMVSRYRQAGFQVTRRFERAFQATFVAVTHDGEPVLGGFATGNVIEQLSVPSTQGCD